MKTVELKNIAGYLPYGLCGYDVKTGLIITNGSWMNLKNNDGIVELSNIGSFKPVLRPLSDMYRQIMHNGEGIVPIIEIAKKLYPNLNWEISDSEVRQHGHLRVGNCGSFIYKEGRNKGNFGEIIDMKDKFCINLQQYFILDYLHELKIDYRGLIDAGLAIDAKKLDINPYK